MRLGLFGGSFDPIHRGHVAPIQQGCAQLGLDRVLFLPTAQPPHKPQRLMAPAHSRYTMVELALLQEPDLFASPYELTLGRPAFTVDTVEHFQAAHPNDEIVLLIGADSFLDLTSWRRYRDLLANTQIGVLARPDCRLQEPAAELVAALRSGRAVELLNDPVAISSTAIRGMLARGAEPPPDFVAPGVLHYIRKYSLYR
jgi:nicotinate-nucleotide adenylyltransferase